MWAMQAMSAIYDAFVANVTERMSVLGMSRSDLARKMQVSPAYISQLLGGHIRSPGLNVIANVAKALDIPTSHLLVMREKSVA